MKKQTWKMHFNNGVPCKWDEESYDEEKENYVFESDLYINGYERGCSSAVLILVPYEDRDKGYFEQKIKYRVFLSDTENIIKRMVEGRVKADFTWVKKGKDYGIKLFIE